jgi:fucose permease
MMKKTKSITRDKFTWLTYLMLGYYSYLLNGLGPVMPFLRAELRMSYTLSSFHFSAFAIGMLLAGLGSDRLARRFGRRRIFWSGALGMAGGVILLLMGYHPVLTISGAFLMGTIGSLLLVMIPAALSDRYGPWRAIALSEANVVASLCGGLAPVAIGFFVKADLGWRGALIVIILTALLLRLIFRHVLFPEATNSSPLQSSSQKRLPKIYWVYWNILVLAVSVEFCIIFWSATFLEMERGLLKANAAFIMSLFLGAMVLGRLIGSRISHYAQSEKIVLGSVGISLIGFFIHWWATPTLLTMSGLFLAGLGVANLYPQILALAIGAAPNQTDTASARASLASGSAILLLPLLLGGLADRIGLWYAYGLVVILLLFVGIGIWCIHRSTSGKNCCSPGLNGQNNFSELLIFPNHVTFEYYDSDKSVRKK